MKCQTVRALLLDSLDQPYPDDVQAHLKTCAECRSYASQIMLMSQRLHHHADHLTAPDDALKRLQAALVAQPENEVVYLDPPPSHPILETLASVFNPLRHNPAVLRAFSALVLIAMFALFMRLVIMPPGPPAASVETAEPAETAEATVTPLPVSATQMPLRIGFIIDAPISTEIRGEHIKFCEADGFSELHVASMTAINVMDKHATGYEFELFEQYDPELESFDGDGLIYLQTRGCDAEQNSGFQLISNDAAMNGFAVCMSTKYQLITGLDVAGAPMPSSEFNTRPDVPSVLIELGSLSADRDLLDHQQGVIADALMAGLDCYTNVLAQSPDIIAEATSTPRLTSTPLPTPISDPQGTIAYNSNSVPDQGLYLYSFGDDHGELVWSSEDWFTIEADWLPDSNQIVWAGYEIAKGTFNFDLYTIDSTNPVPTLLVSLPGDDLNPKWSPDGKKVVFASDVDDRLDKTNYELFVVNVEDGTLTQITYDQATDRQPTWSPDGEWIAYSSDADSNFEIYIIRADGSEGPYPVTQQRGMRDTLPDWSPDGRHIVYARIETDSKGGIYVVSLDDPGAAPDKVVDTSDWTYSYPTWSPDGSMISFIDFQNEYLHLFVVTVDGRAMWEYQPGICCGMVTSLEWLP